MSHVTRDWHDNAAVWLLQVAQPPKGHEFLHSLAVLEVVMEM
jgi:hypothetical protein